MSDQNNQRQIDELTKFGVRPEAIFTDKASGRDLQRPGWQALWKDIEHGDLIVVQSLDRIGRDTLQILQTFRQIHEMGADVKVLTQDIDTRTPSGRLVLSILAAMAQFERELIHERTMHGLAKARDRGRVGGRQKVATDQQVCEAMAKVIAQTRTGREAAAEIGISRAILYRRWKELQHAERAKA